MAEIFLINITCPECTTIFEINLDLLGKEGRYVSCSECDHQWFQYLPDLQKNAVKTHPETPVEKKEPPIDVPPIKELELKEEVLEEKSSFITSQFFLIPVLLSLVFTGLFFARNEVVRFVPGMEKFYNVLGISAYNIGAFQFSNTQWQVINNGSHRSIEITGSVTNTANKLLTPPSIQVTLRGQGECQPSSWIDQLFDQDQNKNEICTIKKWITRLKEGRLFSGQTTSFKVSYPLAATESPVEVLLKFVNREN